MKEMVLKVHPVLQCQNPKPQCSPQPLAQILITTIIIIVNYINNNNFCNILTVKVGNNWYKSVLNRKCNVKI